ncbi:MAG: hypothetical protein CMJ37_01225 [Phycisphaerae bacterium]|nr:hypothetical protein [Phycisphaerae bacterium]
MQYTSKSILFALAASSAVSAQTITFDLTDIESWDGLGSPNNIVLIETLPDVSLINSVSWTDVTGSGFGGPTYGSEMRLDLNGEVVVTFFPDEGSGSAGGDWGPTSGSTPAGFVSNELILEFFESFDDDSDLIDAQYTGGTITISYGTLSDCNGNGVPDAEELGPDTDCDTSGVLDVCENLTDCDANGVPDVCEGSAVPNDLFENAIGLDVNGEVSGSTECAGAEATFGDQCNTSAFTGDGPDVFYAISLQEAGEIDLWTCNSDYDTDLSIHTMDGTVLVCDGDSGDDEAADGCVQYASRIITELPAGDYVVRIGGWQGATGNYVLSSAFSNVIDCNGNGRPDDEDIAGGVSEDCNGSMIPDECEIGPSTDCDGNAVLDECESLPDCDDDGVSDCEAIASGDQDCDANGIPDSCDSVGGTPVSSELVVDTGVLNGGEFVEYVIALDGELDSLRAELTFTNGDADGTWAGDVSIQLTDPSGECVEVGSYNIETCVNGILEDFPTEWDVAENGEYSFTFALCGQDLSGSGDWSIRLTHGYDAGIDDAWSGILTFGVLTDESPCPADLNGDGGVGFSDLSIILSSWLTSDGGDVNGDGETNFSDLSLVLSAWGDEC